MLRPAALQSSALAPDDAKKALRSPSLEMAADSIANQRYTSSDQLIGEAPIMIFPLPYQTAPPRITLHKAPYLPQP
jgi:hypothetical protein